MPTKTNPAITIGRMISAATTLDRWAKEYGSAKQQEIAANLLAVISKVAPHMSEKYQPAPPQPLTPYEQGYRDYPDTTKNFFPADTVEADQWWQGYAAKDAEKSAANPESNTDA
jgi:hypothetical protein